MKFRWTTINVTDMEKSLGFYRDVVGLELDRRFKPAPHMEIAFLGTGETQVELIYNTEGSDADYGAGISLGFEVDSLDNLLPFLNVKGIPVHEGPFQPNPSIRFLYVMDPDGLRIQFLENL